MDQTKADQEEERAGVILDAMDFITIEAMSRVRVMIKDLLNEALRKYPKAQPVTVFEAARLAICAKRAIRVMLAKPTTTRIVVTTDKKVEFE
jgi:hypothetical protein